jgi:hypothetical protein
MNCKMTLIIVIVSTALYCCVSNATKPGGKTNSNSSVNHDTVNYVTDILPVLRTKCSPCHFPGGKMYEKMPFDNSLTILGHETGVFKRIKEEPAAGLIRKFMLQRSKVN